MSTPPSVPPEPPAPSSAVTTPPVAAPVFPTPGESIISLLTGATYEIGQPIGHGSYPSFEAASPPRSPTATPVSVSKECSNAALHASR